MSPELIVPQRFGLESGHPTRSSDCDALGMVVYETISRQMPFHKFKHTDLTIFVKVLEGERPPRGVALSCGASDISLSYCVPFAYYIYPNMQSQTMGTLRSGPV